MTNSKFKAYKYRIYPSSEQAVFFVKTFGCCRKVWNLMLGDKIDFWESDRLPLNVTPAMYKDMYPYLREVDSLALSNVQLDLKAAYNAFFKGISGFPKFKSKRRSKDSYTTNNQNGTIEITPSGIKLPKIGIVSAKFHRLPPSGYKVKSATVSRTDDKYYCSVLFEYEEHVTMVSPDESKVIGLDYKSDGLYCDSNGYCPHPEKQYRKYERRIAKLNKALSKKKGARKGEKASRNFEKANERLSKAYRRSANCRKDFLHKESLRIANLYDAVCAEDLSLKEISGKKNLGKSTYDNGYGMFLRFLEYKLSDRGKRLIKVDRYYASSQICSNCGHKIKLSLSERTYDCPQCHMKIDRDLNAAINIRNEGLRLLGA